MSDSIQLTRSDFPQSIQQMSLLFDQLVSGVILIQCQTRSIAYANQVALDMIGQAKEQVLGRVCHAFICPAQQHSCPILDLGQAVDFSERILLGQGGEVPILKRVSHLQLDGKDYLLESFTDISAQKEQEKILRDIGLRDPLTGLLNRSALLSMIEQQTAWQQETRGKAATEASMLLFGLDHFRTISDTYGHLVADEVLKDFCRLIEATVRRKDQVFRWGGEVLLVWAPDTDPDAAMQLASKLRFAVEQHAFPVSDSQTISCGLATHRPGESFADWLSRTEYCLSRARAEEQGACFSWEAFWRGENTNFRITWQPKWESGNDQIDHEHQALIRGANLMIRHYLYYQDASDPADLKVDLRQVIAMLAEHFANEEQILKDVHYPDLEDHRRLHQTLLDTDRDFVARYEKGEISLLQAMEHLVGDTLVFHMLTDDVRFYPYVRN
ncbi:MAG: diguanylate cyclase [Clostridia bacterium]|nr:diguanylate cyclase [Clostridia bacterium]